MTLRERILNLLFPPKCPFCGRVGETAGVCVACEKALPWTAAGETLRPGSLRCAAPLWYEDLARDGILRLKFGHAAASAEPLGALLARCAAAEFGGEFDTVTWVPVSRKRLKQRGYDQAELLSRAACRLWDTKPVPLLEKPVDNPAQSGIRDAAARRANVLGVYELLPGVDLTGRKILLIDDVCTTGATLAECVRMLGEAGAESVVCAAVAFAREKKKSKTGAL
ncbi:MAG: phosphoribosyltransferase family protein, partial [Oscillibacter sp.]